MSSEVKEYVEALQRKVEQFRKAMTAESDRRCALFGAAYLDVSLSD